AGAGGAEQRPEPLAAVGEKAGHGVGLPGALGGEPEAEVGTVAPEGAVQQGAGPFVRGPAGELVERGQLLVGGGRVAFGEVGGAEGVDALPGAGDEVADGLQQLAVEPALGPQPGHLVPGPAG